MKLKRKLILLTSSLAIVSVLVISIINYSIAIKRIQDEVNSNVQLEAEEAALYIDRWTALQKNTLNETKQFLLMNNNSEPAYLKRVMGRLHRDNPNNEYYIGLENREFYTGSGILAAADYDPTERDWYKNAQELDRMFVTDPYIDTLTGEMVFTISDDLKNFNSMDAAIGTDIPLDYMTSVVSEIDHGEGSYGFLIDKRGDIISHPSQDFLPKAETGFRNLSEVLDGEIGTLMEKTDLNLRERKFTDYDGQEKFLFFTELGEMDWDVGIVVPVNIVMGSINRVIYLTIFAGLGVLVLSILMALYIANYITRPIFDAVDAAESISNLDLSLDIDDDKLNRKDEIGHMYRAFDNTIEKLRSFMAEMDNSIQSNYEVQNQTLERTAYLSN